MALILPDSRFETPELFNPGRYPTGAWRVDLSHKQRPDHLFYGFQPRNSTPFDIVQNKPAISSHSQTVSPYDWEFVHGRWGKQVSNLDDHAQLLSSTTVYAAYVEILKLEDDLDSTTLLRYLTDKSDNGQQLLTFGPFTGYLSDELITIGQGSGRTGFCSNTETIYANQLNRFLWAWNGSNYELWWNGEQRQVTAGSSGHCPLWSDKIYICKRTDDDLVVGMVALWTKHKLADPSSIMSNPYQYFERA